MPIRFTFIIVARELSACRPALDALAQLEWPAHELETLVALGQNPSQQRNQAAVQARGEFLIFLDDDSRLHAKALTYYADALTYEADIGAVGGPSIYHGDNSAFKTALHAVFSSVFGLGPFRARYAPLGRVRATTERDLILCNLLVRKTAFLAEGGFRAELYPNEENEFLTRLSRTTRLYYHPLAICYREPRATFAQFAKQLFSYGAGRAKHLIHFRRAWENIFLVPLGFALYVLVLIAWPFISKTSALYFAPLALYAIFAIAAALLSAIGRKKLWLVCALPPLFFSCHFFYGLGFAFGLLRATLPPAMPSTTVEVIKINV